MPTAEREVREYGAVFTRRWVVEMMLDLVGYQPSSDLSASVAHEPAVGGGAFLLPMVARLSASCRKRGRSIEEARQAIRAWDLQASHVADTRRAVVEQLVGEGWQHAVAKQLAAHWIAQGDYLLRTIEEPEADFVIGNPPYIRAESIPRDLRRAYLERCETMTAGSDVFVGFVERGLRSLKRGGVLCFICADRWMHNSYGRRLRRLVVRDYSVISVIKMHGVDAFAEEVSAYPAVTTIKRAKQSRAIYAEARPSFDQDSAARFRSWATGRKRALDNPDVAAGRLPGWFKDDGLWPSGSPARLRTLEDLEGRLPPLQDPRTGTKIGIGIATGADRVFVTHSREDAEPDRLLPLVKGAHLRTGQVNWAETWLVNPWDEDGKLVDLQKWPRLRRYLEQWSPELRERHVVRRASRDWYRTIDKVHAGLRSTSKLLFQDMKMSSEPVLEHGKYYPHHNLYWVTSDEWDLRVLGGILLSRVAQLFIEAYAVRMRGGTLRFQAQYLRKIRVPRLADMPGDLQGALSRAFTHRDVDAATSAALAAYGIDSIPD